MTDRAREMTSRDRMPTLATASRGGGGSLAQCDGIDWSAVAGDLNAQGCAVVTCLLEPAQCRSLASLYSEDALFRSRVVMSRHGFGRGEYKYFSYPLPSTVARLRA